MSEQHILSEVSVRLIGDSERERHDALLDEQHYLKSGQLVGEQLRYVAEYDGRNARIQSCTPGVLHGARQSETPLREGAQTRCLPSAQFSSDA